MSYGTSLANFSTEPVAVPGASGAGTVGFGEPLEVAAFGAAPAAVSLWNFDGNLNDETGLDTLTLNTGNLSYTRSLFENSTKEKALFIPATSTKIRGANPAPAALRIQGDVTVELVMRMNTMTLGSFGTTIFSCSGITTDSGDANKSLYRLGLRSNGTTGTIYFRSFWHSTGGTAQLVEDNDYHMELARPYLIQFVRAGAVGSLYINNALVFSATLTAPSGTVGDTAGIWIGADFNNNLGVNDMHIEQIKVIPQALSTTDREAEWQKVTGLTP